MLSIIICSREGTITENLRNNIQATTGCKYELIAIDNSQNDYSIFEAYNLGIRKSVYPFLVFVHEDILFHTANWGRILLTMFKEQPQTGLIGIAGSKVKTKMPSAWWEININIWRLIQHFKYKPKEYWDHGFNDGELEKVAIIDGVFMAMRKDSKIKFDERLKGFHNYDLSLSLQHKKLNKKVGVTRRILIEHFSEGNLDKSWYKSTSEFHRLYNKCLPLQAGNSFFSNSELRKKEIKLGYNFVNKLIENDLMKEAYYWWWQLFILKPVSKYHFRIFNKIISG